MFTSARKKLSLNAGRPSISDDTKETIKAFLERPGISYCKPGRNDTVTVVKIIKVSKNTSPNTIYFGQFEKSWIYSTRNMSTQHISVHYIDKSNIIINDLIDAVYIPGTLQIHHVNRISQSCIEFYYNSPYKKESTKVSIYHQIYVRSE